MRLLLTGDTAGGVLTFVSELTNGMHACGIDVSLATFGPKPSRAITGARWFHHVSKLEWQPDPWSDLQLAARWLNELAAREQPDLVHLNTLCHGDLPWNVPVVTTIHSCVPSWWSAVKQTPLTPDWDRYRSVVTRSLHGASLIAVPTRALREALSTVWPIDLSNAAVVPNGRDPRLFRIGKKEPMVLSAGRFWDEAKNIAALDDVSSSISWPLYLAGESQGSARCHLLGRLSEDELAGWYARASIYVSAASYEPFGLAILEAAMSGCALVLNDIPSLHEVWGDAAVFCNTPALGATLQELIADPVKRTEMQQRAFARSRRFTQSAMTRHYLAIYSELNGYACAS